MSVRREVYEAARDHAGSLLGTDVYERSRRERKNVETLFDHLKRHLGLPVKSMRAYRHLQL